jgi:hypothetical protein
VSRKSLLDVRKGMVAQAMTKLNASSRGTIGGQTGQANCAAKPKLRKSLASVSYNHPLSLFCPVP